VSNNKSVSLLKYTSRGGYSLKMVYKRITILSRVSHNGA